MTRIPLDDLAADTPGPAERWFKDGQTKRWPGAPAPRTSAYGIRERISVVPVRHRRDATITLLPSGSATSAIRSPHGWSAGSATTRTPCARRWATANTVPRQPTIGSTSS